MKPVRVALVGLFLGVFLLFSGTTLQAAELGIVTGSKTGTYYQFGLDISKILKGTGVDLKVYNSKGSLANMYSVLREPHAQLAIVQSDVLKFLSYSENEEARQMVKKTRLVYPLYNEEVHVLANKNISSLTELEGKKVAIGGKGSGTSLTAKTLFKLAEISPIPVFSGGEAALEMLKSGEIDAMFYVAGYPVSLFKDNVSLSDNLHLLEIIDKNITEFYVPSTIPAKAYSWMKDDVNLVAVKAVVMTFNYKGDNCQYIYKIGQRIRNSLNELKENGHSKWKEVNLDLELGGWRPYGCLKAGKYDDDKVGWLTKMVDEM